MVSNDTFRKFTRNKLGNKQLGGETLILDIKQF